MLWFLVILICMSSAKSYVFETKWFSVPVDHFDFGVNDTFKIRYLINDTYWDKSNGGPIFFYTGNEGDIETFANNTGFMWDIAPDFEALIVFAEHRYYGKSLPYGNNSYTVPKNLGYLSSSQALADYAELLTYLQKNNTSQDKSFPVIAFGGSYGGMLAAWFRMKYPYIVDGSIAASAPILQFTGMVPCEAFARIITADFKAVSPVCAEKIRASWAAIDRITSKDDGLKWLSSNWSLCSPLKTKDNVTDLKDWMIDSITNAAMLDYPYPTNFLLPLPAYPVQAMCRKLTSENSSNVTADDDRALLMKMFSMFGVYFNHTGKAKCLDVKETDTDPLMDKGWDYQACTEMVMPICYDGEGDMFEPKPWNIEEEAKRCKDEWGINPQPNLAQMLYGGRKAVQYATNIIFSNGLLDPWSSGGVLKNGPKGSGIVSIIIPEGAHHLDLRGKHPNDPVSVMRARKVYVQYIRKWIRAAKSNFK